MKRITELSWFTQKELKGVDNLQFIAELNWVNKHALDASYSELQVTRMLKYRKLLQADYQRRKQNNWR
jgi:hypothetical protein